MPGTFRSHQSTKLVIILIRGKFSRYPTGSSGTLQPHNLQPTSHPSFPPHPNLCTSSQPLPNLSPTARLSNCPTVLRTHLRIIGLADPLACRRGKLSALLPASYGRICSINILQVDSRADVARIPSKSAFLMDASARGSAYSALFPQMRPTKRRTYAWQLVTSSSNFYTNLSLSNSLKQA